MSNVIPITEYDAENPIQIDIHDNVCTICFDEIGFVSYDFLKKNPNPYGCGNNNCTAMFCDNCITHLSERYIHTHQCCACTEPPLDKYLSRLDTHDVVIILYSGEYFMMVRKFSNIQSPLYMNSKCHDIISFWKSPALKQLDDIPNLQKSFCRAVKLLPQNSTDILRSQLQQIIVKNEHLIEWIHSDDNTRWGVIRQILDRYNTTNYKIIGIIAQICVYGFIFMMWLYLCGGYNDDTNIMKILVVSSIFFSCFSYFMLLTQIFYIDIDIIPINYIVVRVSIVTIVNAIIITINILGLIEFIIFPTYVYYMFNILVYQLMSGFMMTLCYD